MTQTPAGWFPDPYYPDQPYLRWWDGTQWTEHAAQALPVAPRTPTIRPSATPDGQALAGWGRRFGAFLIDLVVLVPLQVWLAWGQSATAVRQLGDLFARLDAAVVSGTSAEPVTVDMPWTPIVLALLIVTGASAAYHVGFLGTLRATPGKLAFGIRVRRWDVNELSWSRAAGRWVAARGWAYAIVWPATFFVPPFLVLDGLSSLWDKRRQALHDIPVGTVVVRRRSTGIVADGTVGSA
jgi:uncharacterized RDD family membrane protein YckC